MVESLDREGKPRRQVNGWDYKIAAPKSRLAERTGGCIVVMMMMLLLF